MNTAAILAIVSLVGTACYVLAVVVLHILPTGRQPVRDPVSDYATTRYGAVIKTGLLAGGVGTLALAVATELAAAPVTEIVVLLVVAGVCRLALMVITTDPAGRPRTVQGRTHLILAIVYFAVLITAMANSDVTGSWLSDIAIAATVLLIIAVLFPQVRGFFGLFERVVLAATHCWLILDAVRIVMSR